jgi:hypothetical protein
VELARLNDKPRLVEWIASGIENAPGDAHDKGPPAVGGPVFELDVQTSCINTRMLWIALPLIRSAIRCPSQAESPTYLRQVWHALSS